MGVTKPVFLRFVFFPSFFFRIIKTLNTYCISLWYFNVSTAVLLRLSICIWLQKSIVFSWDQKNSQRRHERIELLYSPPQVVSSHRTPCPNQWHILGYINLILTGSRSTKLTVLDTMDDYLLWNFEIGEVFAFMCYIHFPCGQPWENHTVWALWSFWVWAQPMRDDATM